MRTAQIVVILLIGVIAVLYALDLAGDGQGVTDLAPAEVREYQGEQLSSITDFRENSIRGPQYVNASTYTLTVDGLVEDREEYSYDALMERFPRYRKVVTLYCVEGWDVTILWEGIRVEDLLLEAGVKPGANTVIFYAADGYSSSLPLAYIEDRDILLAYAMNNVTLPAERGFPFQLVAEDRWGYKWVKWVTRIEVSDDANYRGYWESRGYSNNGSLDRSFFDRG
ncbi:molybdopterin-dependent oxidoreductase [Methanoculleus sp. Wushi-C6]|uniref:Molybdopterin-dependent oxidoreductase n=1 Tax=Methanoculleus caldifontis TaxID=2651577 RepID=A0ABU3X403_9EURY|nr:molybdopterin-dependent oxidoreductase [Methanoculleus sp. Wushi-C6]MDV2482790.1 molybdopterin-dependent oxidoreductase [Methanoculleus sp. Wushi-C6]